MTGPGTDPLKRFFGFALMSAGVLLIALCGMCALGVLTTVFTEAGSFGGAIGSIVFVLAIAGGAATGGYAIFRAGRNLWRAG